MANETSPGSTLATNRERKLVAILSADVAGYSRLMDVDETATLDTLTAYRVVTDALIQLANCYA
jgi:class 3 adenylate cyclase